MKHPSTRGFSLVEISIVLVIIGLIIGGILVGQKLIDAAENRSLITELGEHQAAIGHFVSRYNALPGDFALADLKFDQTKAEVIAIAGFQNGNGNNRIEWDQGEGTLAWKHLEIAKLTEGRFDLTASNNEEGLPGVNIPAAKIAEGLGYFLSWTAGDMQNHFQLSATNGGGTLNAAEPILNAAQAHDIDRTLDDGLPNLGLVRYNSASPEAINCVQGAGTGMQYVLQSDAARCVVLVKLSN